MPFTYAYPHMAVAADVAVFDDARRILLVQRGRAPYKDQWALPGGYVEIDERIESAARRELSEETGLAPAALKFVGFFDAVDRDPRERTVTFVFYAFCTEDPHAGDDAANARWFTLDALPPLAFDHSELITAAVTAAFPA